MKRIFAIVIIIFSTTCIGSCRNLISQINENVPLWTIPITSGGLIFASVPVYLHEEDLIVAGDNRGETVLYILDKEDGVKKWEWLDWVRKGESAFALKMYAYKNTLAFQTINGVYIVDFSTRKTINKFPIRSGGQSITGIGETFFFQSGLLTIVRGNITTGQIIDSISFNSTPEYRSGIYTPTPFIAANGDIMIVTAFTQIKNTNIDSGKSSLILYNLTKQQTIYSIEQQDISLIGLPVVLNNRIYSSFGTVIQCNDLWSGKLLWRTPFTSGFLFSGVTVADGKVFGACEDTNLYALDAETGRILWKQPIAGTTQQPFFMNGVVYIASGGDGKLYAVDATTGQIIWAKECPERAQNNSVFFFGWVTGANGKIYVQSYKSAYCYKAAR